MVDHYELTQGDRVLQFASLNFDASLEEILPALLAGAAVVLRDKDLWTPLEFQKKVLHYGLTVVNLPPSYFHEWVQACVEVSGNTRAHQLRLIICGGDELLPATVRLWEKSPMSSARLLNAYGPTETTITATTFEVNNRSRDKHVREVIPERIPIGRPLPNRKIYILDRFNNLLPAGFPGELYIGGTCLAQGYLNRPELTAEKFVPDPFGAKPNERLYKTGDLARYLPDGNIEFLGRIDHQVKVRGYRIEPGEIESILAHHPGIKETAVMAREALPGDKRLVAYVVLNEKSSIATNNLRDFLKEKLPDYMVPSVFVVLDTLPLTPNGKIDRKALPAPDTGRLYPEHAFVAPRTPIEEMLAGIWCEVLELSQVGIHDNFFELGGHSLVATQVISRLRKVFEVEIPLRTLFESPTVEKLALDLLQRECECKTVEQRTALFLKVTELSEDEVNTMLAEQIRKRHNKTDE
jgi:acyl-CoA synthetase (AMP-forming)/AMP-acid ligase II/acyl carrier protein